MVTLVLLLPVEIRRRLSVVVNDDEWVKGLAFQRVHLV